MVGQRVLGLQTLEVRFSDFRQSSRRLSLLRQFSGSRVGPWWLQYCSNLHARQKSSLRGFPPQQVTVFVLVKLPADSPWVHGTNGIRTGRKFMLSGLALRIGETVRGILIKQIHSSGHCFGDAHSAPTASSKYPCLKGNSRQRSLEFL